MMPGRVWASHLYAALHRAFGDPGRFTSYKSHPCGCETWFDTLDWRSRTIVECAEHASARRSLIGGNAP